MTDLGLTDRIQRYRAAACLSGVLFAGISTSADASIVFINFSNQLLADSNVNDTAYERFAFDLNGDGTADFAFDHQLLGNTDGAARLVNPNSNSPLQVVGFRGGNLSFYKYPLRLAAGANIGPTQAFVTLAGTGFGAFGSLALGNGYPNSQWTNDSTPGFLGFQFTAGGSSYYGWIQISIAPNNVQNGRAITLISAAYDDTGIPIVAGAVPEPTTSVGLLALGAAGLLAHRRRRAA